MAADRGCNANAAQDNVAKKTATRFIAVRDGFGSFVSSFVSLGVFWVATLLGMTVPYRFWLESKCGFATLTVVKAVEAG